METCYACGGIGAVGGNLCGICNGSGKLQEFVLQTPTNFIQTINSINNEINNISDLNNVTLENEIYQIRKQIFELKKFCAKIILSSKDIDIREEAFELVETRPFVLDVDLKTHMPVVKFENGLTIEELRIKNIIT